MTEPQCKVEVEEASSLLGSSKSNSVAHCTTSEISSATIDLSNNEDVATSSTEERDVWVTHGKLTLKLVDKEAIELGDELNDKHIQMAQYLAKVQFSVKGGLELILPQGKRKGRCTIDNTHTWIGNAYQNIYAS